MDNRQQQVVTDFVEAVEEAAFSEAAAALTEDFVYKGDLPEIGKEDFMTLLLALKQAFPDMRFNLRELQTSPDKVQGVLHLSATHSGRLDLTVPELPAVRATGERLDLPEEEITFELEANKIRCIKVTPEPGGGFGGLLQELAVTVNRMDVRDSANGKADVHVVPTDIPSGVGVAKDVADYDPEDVSVTDLSQSPSAG